MGAKKNKNKNKKKKKREKTSTANPLYTNTTYNDCKLCKLVIIIIWLPWNLLLSGDISGKNIVFNTSKSTCLEYFLIASMRQF